MTDPRLIPEVTPHPAPPSVAAWATVSVTRMTGWVNLYRFPGADGGLIARPAPAMLTQVNPEGCRRDVFAVAIGPELVHADIYPNGYISTVRADVWHTYSGHVGWLDILFARETGAPLP